MKKIVAFGLLIIMLIQMILPVFAGTGGSGGGSGGDSMYLDETNCILYFKSDSTKAAKTAVYRWQLIGWLATITDVNYNKTKYETVNNLFVKYPRGKDSWEWFSIPIYIDGEKGYPNTSIESAYNNQFTDQKFTIINDYGGYLELQPRIMIYYTEDDGVTRQPLGHSGGQFGCSVDEIRASKWGGIYSKVLDEMEDKGRNFTFPKNPKKKAAGDFDIYMNGQIVTGETQSIEYDQTEVSVELRVKSNNFSDTQDITLDSLSPFEGVYNGKYSNAKDRQLPYTIKMNLDSTVQPFQFTLNWWTWDDAAGKEVPKQVKHYVNLQRKQPPPQPQEGDFDIYINNSVYTGKTYKINSDATKQAVELRLKNNITFQAGTNITMDCIDPGSYGNVYDGNFENFGNSKRTHNLKMDIGTKYNRFEFTLNWYSWNNTKKTYEFCQVKRFIDLTRDEPKPPDPPDSANVAAAFDGYNKTIRTGATEITLTNQSDITIDELTQKYNLYSNPSAIRVSWNISNTNDYTIVNSTKDTCMIKFNSDNVSSASKCNVTLTITLSYDGEKYFDDVTHIIGARPDPIPILSLNMTGKLKEDRFVMFDGSASRARYGFIDWETGYWDIYKYSNGSYVDITEADNVYFNNQKLVSRVDELETLNNVSFGTPGKYKIRLSVRAVDIIDEVKVSTRGEKEVEFTIGNDLAPTSDFVISQSKVYRDSSGEFVPVTITDNSYSTDGDTVRDVKFSYSSDKTTNNPVAANCTGNNEISSGASGGTAVFKPDGFGVYKIDETAYEVPGESFNTTNYNNKNADTLPSDPYTHAKKGGVSPSKTIESRTVVADNSAP